MTSARRSYSANTIKILFALSGNRCAYPSCPQPVIQLPTDESDALVMAQIAHIYAASDNGPRGKPGLTDEEKNAVENLLLLCPNHHRLVDGQHESYSAEVLKVWKERRETAARLVFADTVSTIPSSGSIRSFGPQALVDKELELELSRLRRARFFVGSSSATIASSLATRIMRGDLASGSDEVKARALAWCARFLSRESDGGAAREPLELAALLGHGPEVAVARAFMADVEQGEAAALQILAALPCGLARSAALFVVSYHRNATTTIEWVSRSGLQLEDFDPDGKFLLISKHLEARQWDVALERSAALRSEDFLAVPALLFIAAAAHLLYAIPEELRDHWHQQVPFEARRFPLASDSLSLSRRQTASELFARCVAAARELECTDAANTAEDLVLWLHLRDPRETDRARDVLKASLSDHTHALRRVHLALQFDIEIDRAAAEREIDKRIALNGTVTADAALARFSLAVAQDDARAVADYIDGYRTQLVGQVDAATLGAIEVQALAAAGFADRAQNRLEELSRDGLPPEDRLSLERIVQKTADAVQQFQAQYETSGRLIDLENLVRALEKAEQWTEMATFGMRLFEKTHSILDAERVARALNAQGQFIALSNFLAANPEFLPQSDNLHMLWCWSLYRQGAFAEATAKLSELQRKRDIPQGRQLEVNLFVASGEWEALVPLVEREWIAREARDAEDLLNAAQLGRVTGSPRARGLLWAAAKQGQDDPISASQIRRWRTES